MSRDKVFRRSIECLAGCSQQYVSGIGTFLRSAVSRIDFINLVFPIISVFTFSVGVCNADQKDSPLTRGRIEFDISSSTSTLIRFNFHHCFPPILVPLSYGIVPMRFS
jgi:hypothetical protein